MADTNSTLATHSGLSLADVTLRAGAVSFSHTFPKGKITVVLGGNDAGKTDLCRYIAGLSSTVQSGHLSLNGEDWDKRPTRQRPVGYVYQAFVNYPNYTVEQNIASPLKAQGRLSAEEIRAEVLALATKLRIDPLLERFPHELSGGQQQRLAIARALARQAEVLLLDEPLVNLDFKLREALEVELRELLRATNTVVVYTSSDQRDAYTLADDVLLLDAGEKLQSGSPMALYREPVSLAAMRIMADPQVNTWQENDALHAVRPEHLELLGASDHADHEFDLALEGVETDGSHTMLFGRCRDSAWAVTCLGMVDLDIDATLGSNLRIGTDAANVVTFRG